MEAKDYQQIENKIYNKFPTGIDHMVFGDPDTLFEKLSGKITIPVHFDSECAIHQMNLLATEKHLKKYTTKIQLLYNIATKMRKSSDRKHKHRINVRIDRLATLINECRENIKMSQYGIEQKLTGETHLMKRNISG